MSQDINNSMSEEALQIVNSILTRKDGEQFPRPFTASKKSYWLFESVVTMSLSEVNEILSDDAKFDKQLRLSPGNLNQDFFDFYLGSNNVLDTHVDLALKAIKDGHRNKLIDFIIADYAHQVVINENNHDEFVLTYWRDKLEKYFLTCLSKLNF
ncbi:hypothetical protein K1728_00770 [Weissella confusa]|uniref:hypothetical protein n=1 Tax=Weissella confusa TaxID=1583 RepID=UPI001C6FA558|nr:hypothetical protein [Weissella confusa]QYU57978.1 hypothetical protein K1728_00770 [Weissella confusa]